VGTGSGQGLPFTSHLQTSNYLFADGHVKSLKPMGTYDCVDNGINTCASGVNQWSISSVFQSTALETALKSEQANM
jgi:prepilin-type processing-associated H-X9-DG protein